jgi:hypothetical protein
MPRSRQDRAMPILMIILPVLALFACVRWLRPLLVLPWGLFLLVVSLWARSDLCKSYGGRYFEPGCDTWFPIEIPGTASAGFGFVWSLTVFLFAVAFFAGSRFLVRSAQRKQEVPDCSERRGASSAVMNDS